MVDLSLGPFKPDELIDALRLDALVWGHELDDVRVRCFTEFLEPDRMIGIRDGSQLVGMLGIVGQRLTVPGGRQLDMAGFTWLAVHPLYRGRGLTTKLHRAALELVHEPVAGAMAHDSSSRGQYGSAPATRCADVELILGDRRDLHGMAASGTLEYMDLPAWLPVLRHIAGRLAGVRNGWVPRKPCLDEYRYSRAAITVGGFGPTTFVAHRTADGEPDGCLSYRLSSGADTHGRPAGVPRVVELLATSPGTQAELWQHCISNPLVERIEASRRPPADPVVVRLPDPRAWRQTLREDANLSIWDVPAALAARCYGRDDRLVLEVQPAQGPAERVELAGGLTGAECRRVDRPPDLTLSGVALSSAYLGDTPLDLLAAAGEVVEHRAGSVRRATAMFSWSPAPWVQDSF